MKTFFGDIYIEAQKLKEEGIEYPIKVEYYKLKDENNKKYGIEIIKKEYKTENINIENQTINSLTKSEKKIEKILKIFERNEVTPICAEEIIEDFFGKTLAKTIKLS